MSAISGWLAPSEFNLETAGGKTKVLEGEKVQKQLHNDNWMMSEVYMQKRTKIINMFLQGL